MAQQSNPTDKRPDAGGQQVRSESGAVKSRGQGLFHWFRRGRETGVVLCVPRHAVLESLVRNGLLQREERPDGTVYYDATDAGRALLSGRRRAASPEDLLARAIVGAVEGVEGAGTGEQNTASGDRETEAARPGSSGTESLTGYAPR